MSSISVRFNSILSFIRFSMITIAISLTGKLLVGLDGLEPSTSRLSGVRSNHLSYRPSTLMASFVPSLSAPADAPFSWDRIAPVGGDDGVRTHDPLLAGQVLSQLSYTPLTKGLSFAFKDLRSLKIEQQKLPYQAYALRSRPSRLRYARESLPWSP